jgi:hypothetical protein
VVARDAPAKYFTHPMLNANVMTRRPFRDAIKKVPAVQG